MATLNSSPRWCCFCGVQCTKAPMVDVPILPEEPSLSPPMLACQDEQACSERRRLKGESRLLTPSEKLLFRALVSRLLVPRDCVRRTSRAQWIR